VLNSKNANYSFGALQRILEEGISKINLKKINSVLLLGLGGGSIIYSLRDKFNYNGKIHAIDIDQKVISIAKHEFGIATSTDLRIDNCDALEFVKNSSSNYDLIIVDLFIDNQVPAQFYTLEFCEYLSGILSKTGSIVFNLGINIFNSEKGKHARVVEYFEKSQNYHCTLLEHVHGTNLLFIIEKIFVDYYSNGESSKAD
jgi:spermidine synthase